MPLRLRVLLKVSVTAAATDIPSSCDSGTKTSIPQISAFVKRNIEICIRKPYKCSNTKKGALTVYLDHSETKPPPLNKCRKMHLCPNSKIRISPRNRRTCVFLKGPSHHSAESITTITKPGCTSAQTAVMNYSAQTPSSTPAQAGRVFGTPRMQQTSQQKSITNSAWREPKFSAQTAARTLVTSSPTAQHQPACAIA